MSGNIIFQIRGSNAISNSWKQELTITDKDVRCEVIQGLKKIQMTLPFDRIAQVSITRGVLRADIEVVNKGGTDNIKVRALLKDEAEKAKKIIEEKISASVTLNAHRPASLADELAKLAKLKSDGFLTESEFADQKKRLLGD